MYRKNHTNEAKSLGELLACCRNELLVGTIWQGFLSAGNITTTTENITCIILFTRLIRYHFLFPFSKGCGAGNAKWVGQCLMSLWRDVTHVTHVTHTENCPPPVLPALTLAHMLTEASQPRSPYIDVFTALRTVCHWCSIVLYLILYRSSTVMHQLMLHQKLKSI